MISNIIIWQGKSERSDWSFLGRDFAIRTVSVETVISCVFFAFESRQTSMARVPYNKLLTNLASLSRTGEYWPSVVFVQTSQRSVRTATTSGQYSAVRPSCSASKRLIRRPHRQPYALIIYFYSAVNLTAVYCPVIKR